MTAKPKAVAKTAAPAVAKPAKRVHPPLKIPKTLAGCADRLYELKAKRLAEGKAVAELAADETTLKNYLIENLGKGEASGVAGKLARVTIVKQPIPQIKDEAKLWAAIKKSPKKWGHLVAKPTIDQSVLMELFLSGEVPPGVETFNVIKVSLNKV